MVPGWIGELLTSNFMKLLLVPLDERLNITIARRKQASLGSPVKRMSVSVTL